MQVDNTMSYATRTLANHMAGMAAQIGILQQKVDELSQANQILKDQLKQKEDELKQANQILKDQLKQKEGNANDTAKSNTDNGQEKSKRAKAAPSAK